MIRSDGRLYIALGGKAGHGKTTLARDLQNYYRCHDILCEITSFAATPKRMLSAMGLTDEQLYGNQKETPTPSLAGHTPRYAMQTLATEWGRSMLYEDIWVDAWQRYAESLGASVVIVDDLRHVPELERLNSLGAVILEVYRPAVMPQSLWQRARHFYKQLFAHSSERLNFRSHGVQRVLVEEGNSIKTLEKALAFIHKKQ